MKTKQIISELLRLVKENEWFYPDYNDPNKYCPECVLPGERNQAEHHPGCKFVEVVTAAEEYFKVMNGSTS